MGFLDDLGKSLNKVGKKTSEMASVAKLKLEITKHKSAIDNKYEQLGSRIYFLNKEGVELDESIDNFIVEIDELFEAIKLIEVELEKVSEASANRTPKVLVCNNCGVEIAPDTKFCGSCGNKVEVVKERVNESVTEVKKCPNCEAEVGEAKFCNSCGTSID